MKAYMESQPQIKSLNWRSAPFSRTAAQFMNIILPPPGSLTNSYDEHIWTHVRHLDEPCCESCGFPFPYDRGVGSLCMKCMTDPPDFDKTRSAFQYHEDSCALILSFKHGGRTVNLRRFGHQLARAGRNFWPETDMIIPVPLHRQRLTKRRYNQAALLARTVSQITGTPQNPDILLRHKDTASQGYQTPKGRFRNVRGAFTVPETERETLKGKTVVLIDDVYTTGATLNACSRALRRAGAANIYGLTLARVVKDQEIIT